MLLALDLFCGGGGACIGMQQAGFEVVGVDIAMHKNYPGHFIQADIESLPVDVMDFDFVWASPPCQAFSVMNNMQVDKTKVGKQPNLISFVRDLLQRHPYTAIENVIKAPIRADAVLTGPSVGLPYVYRKRHFELSFLVMHPPPQRVCPDHWRSCQAISITNGSTSKAQHYRRVANGLPGKPTTEECKAVMGIPVHYEFSRKEISEAIPPAYSKLISGYARRFIEDDKFERCV